MTNNNYNVQTDEQIARDILSILPDAPEDPNKEPTESPKVFMLPIRQLKSFQNHPFKIVDNDEMKDLMHSITTKMPSQSFWNTRPTKTRWLKEKRQRAPWRLLRREAKNCFGSMSVCTRIT